jgi:PAS domain S-box-containing protein
MSGPDMSLIDLMSQEPERPLSFPADLVDQLSVVLADAVALICTDLDGVVTTWTLFAERLYGWTRDEAIGANIADLTVGPVTADTANAIMDRLRNGLHWSGRFDARRRDGALFSVDVLNAPIVNENGEIVGILGLSRESADQFDNSLSELANLRELAGQLDDVRRDEARRIAGQVHDEFSQRLHLAIQYASTLASDESLPQSARMALRRLVEMQGEMVQVMHGVCGSLRPPLFDELGLVVAIEHLAEATEQLGVSVAADLDPELNGLDVRVAEVVLAIVQEALANVIAHAKAETCRVEVMVDDDVVTISVSDDGVGFDAPWGFGVRLMTERARRLGGTLRVGSADDGGTVVAASLPVVPLPHPPSTSNI